MVCKYSKSKLQIITDPNLLTELKQYCKSGYLRVGERTTSDLVKYLPPF